MNLNQKEIGQRFESFQQRRGIADIIESRSLLNMIKITDNERLPMAHEEILFSTISGSFDMPIPKIQPASMQGNDSASKEEQEDTEIKNTASKKWGYKSSLNI